MYHYAPFYKVVVLKLDVFESSIVDERHFKTNAEAHLYSDTMQEAGYVTIIAAM